MATEKLFYIGVKGLIANSSGQYLLLKSSLRNHTVNTKVYWDIPGGRIEEGSDALTTLKREIAEETGVTGTTDIEFYTAVISNHQIPIDETKKAGLLLMVYKVKIPEDSVIKLSDEHTEFEWVNGSEAAERLSNKYPAEFTSILSS